LTTPHIRLGVEALEGRDCPAIANLFNGVLTVVGADGGDTIIVDQTANGRWITAAGQAFATVSVNALVISGGSGNDEIVNKTQLHTVIYGGAGNDNIVGGPGNDIVYGGQGNDTINSRGGNNVIFGGSGSNSILAAKGINSINNGDPQVALGNSAIETQIIQMINNYRAENGVAPLTVNAQLNVAATMHSQDMVSISNIYGPNVGMQHELFGTLHPEVTDRLDAAGYDDWSTSFAWGENIAYGFNSAADVVNAWINSPDHRANILNPNFTDTGVSVQVSANGMLFFTQDFGHVE
jgi:uncharacterized protein YkwD